MNWKIYKRLSRVNRYHAEDSIMQHGSRLAREWLLEYRKNHPDTTRRRDEGNGKTNNPGES